MAEALEHAVHVARVGQVLEARYAAAIYDSVTLKSLVRYADLPIGYRLYLRSTLLLMETQVTG